MTNMIDIDLTKWPKHYLVYFGDEGADAPTREKFYKMKNTGVKSSNPRSKFVVARIIMNPYGVNPGSAHYEGYMNYTGYYETHYPNRYMHINFEDIKLDLDGKISWNQE